MRDRENWEDVAQTAPARASAALPVALTLKARIPGAPVKLILSLRGDVAARLGWQSGTKLGLSIGRAGRMAGWLRIAPSAQGVALFAFGRKTKSNSGGFHGTLLVRLDPGDDLARWTGPRMAPEYVEQGQALLCRIPWEFNEEEGAAEATAEAA